MLMLMLGLVDGGDEAFLDTLRQILQLVEIVAHLLLTLELGGHHSGFQFLLLGVRSRLAGFARLLEELEAVGH